MVTKSGLKILETMVPAKPDPRYPNRDPGLVAMVLCPDCSKPHPLNRTPAECERCGSPMNAKDGKVFGEDQAVRAAGGLPPYRGATDTNPDSEE